jgi:hemoglobin
MCHPGRLDLTEAHRPLHITSAEFDEVVRLLAASLDHFHVPEAEKNQVIAAFNAHKAEVVSGHM